MVWCRHPRLEGCLVAAEYSIKTPKQAHEEQRKFIRFAVRLERIIAGSQA
jgi:hypothetical protein